MSLTFSEQDDFVSTVAVPGWLDDVPRDDADVSTDGRLYSRPCPATETDADTVLRHTADGDRKVIGILHSLTLIVIWVVY